MVAAFGRKLVSIAFRDPKIFHKYLSRLSQWVPRNASLRGSTSKGSCASKRQESSHVSILISLFSLIHDNDAKNTYKNIALAVNVLENVDGCVYFVLLLFRLIDRKLVDNHGRVFARFTLLGTFDFNVLFTLKRKVREYKLYDSDDSNANGCDQCERVACLRCIFIKRYETLCVVVSLRLALKWKLNSTCCVKCLWYLDMKPTLDRWWNYFLKIFSPENKTYKIPRRKFLKSIEK